MPRQSMTVADAINQANHLWRQGHVAPAKQIFSQILARFPESHEAREGLKLLYQQQLGNRATLAKQDIESAIEEIRHSKHFRVYASKGWTYAMVVDHAYIDSDLKSPDSGCATDSTDFDPGNDITDGPAPAYYFKVIRGLTDIHERISYVQGLTREHSKSLLADSFVDISKDKLTSELRELFAEGGINIVIVGAGVAGLVLANTLKNTFKAGINVLVMENRVYSAGYKKPYARNWITYVLLSLVQDILDEEVTAVLEQLGQDGYMGVPINIFETLLLLSCKKLGVKFLFNESTDFSILEGVQLDAVFDATGNRFDAETHGQMQKPALSPSSVPMQVNAGIAEGYTKFGVNPKSCRGIEKLDILASGNSIFPCFKGQRIRTAMVKITAIPARLFEPIFAAIIEKNEDNRFYLWKGTLKEEINQTLLIVNVTRLECEVLQAYLEAPITVASFLENFSRKDELDHRFIGILELINDLASCDDPPMIEPPFIYEPYLHLYPKNWAKINGAPLIRIGDSIFNGHVKCGNGLGPHLHHLRFIHDAFLKSQISDH